MAIFGFRDRRKNGTAVLLLATAFVFVAACGSGSPASAPASAPAPATSASAAASEPAASSATTASAAADIVSRHSTPLLNAKYITPSGTPVDTTKFKKGPPYTIAFINWSALNSWTVQVSHEIEDEASRYPEIGNFISIHSNGDATTQISQIEDMISRKVDAIITIPIDPKGLGPSIDKANAAGIPVFLIGGDFKPDTLVSLIAGSDLVFGREQGDWLMKTLGCKGQIIVLNGLTGNVANDARRQGLTDAMKACPDGGVNVKILGEAAAAWAYDQGKLATERLLAAHPQIDGVWSQGGAMTQGAMDAFKAAGRALVPMTGEDNNGYLVEWQEGMAKGFKGMAASNPTYQSRIALQAALDTLQGLPVDHNYTVTAPTIEDAQLSQYAKPEYTDAYWAESLLPKAVADKYYLKP